MRAVSESRPSRLAVLALGACCVAAGCASELSTVEVAITAELDAGCPAEPIIECDGMFGMWVLDDRDAIVTELCIATLASDQDSLVEIIARAQAGLETPELSEGVVVSVELAVVRDATACPYPPDPTQLVVGGRSAPTALEPDLEELVVPVSCEGLPQCSAATGL